MTRCTLCSNPMRPTSAWCSLPRCDSRPHHQGCRPHRIGRAEWGDANPFPWTWQGLFAVAVIVGCMLLAGWIEGRP